VAPTYQPAGADAGWYVRVVETAANATGTTIAASPVVGPVKTAAAPAPAPAPPAVVPAPSTPPPPPPSHAKPRPVTKVFPGVVGAGSIPAARGIARLTLSCPSACNVTIRLVAGGRTIATGRTAGQAGSRPTTALTLSRAARMKLARRGRLAAVVQITVGGVTRRVSIVLRDAAAKPRRRPAV
jgi:hypothetical protein